MSITRGSIPEFNNPIYQHQPKAQVNLNFIPKKETLEIRTYKKTKINKVVIPILKKLGYAVEIEGTTFNKKSLIRFATENLLKRTFNKDKNDSEWISKMANIAKNKKNIHSILEKNIKLGRY